jgi:site-specific DNA-methyltransferase (adenine-specific)
MESEGTATIKAPTAYREYSFDGHWGRLYLGDVTDLLGSLEHESVDLIFLDPPFNLAKRYSDDDPKMDHREPKDYESWMKGILDKCVDVLSPGGALYMYHLPEWGIRFGSHLDRQLLLRHWIAISMKNGFVRGDYLYPAHYALLYFTKGKPATFNRPRIDPALCRKCGDTIKDYGGYKSIIEDKGLNLSDFWEDLSPVRHSNRKLRSQNQLPLRMLRRVVEISGMEDMTFLDPFAGTGTGVVAAVERGMNFIAGDNVKANCQIIDRRLERFLAEGGDGS